MAFLGKIKEYISLKKAIIEEIVEEEDRCNKKKANSNKQQREMGNKGGNSSVPGIVCRKALPRVVQGNKKQVVRNIYEGFQTVEGHNLIEQESIDVGREEHGNETMKRTVTNEQSFGVSDHEQSPTGNGEESSSNEVNAV